MIRKLALIVTIGVLIAGAYGWHRVGTLDRPLSAAGGSADFEIARGATLRDVSQRLAEADIIDDPLVFELYGRLQDAGRHIKAGRYTVDLSQTPRRLLEQIVAGTLPAQVKLTVPEGWNRWEIADRLAALGLADREAFLARVEADGLEGRLFPDTYWMKPDAGVDATVARLTARFDAVWRDVLAEVPPAARPRGAPATREALILASLIEKEARTERDRRLVSRVFHNRIAKGMKLQTDPTCVYDVRWYREKPHPRYCRDPQSRYSTYVIDGLPPGPIANPGRAALRAALLPATEPGTERLLFFVAKRDASGEHHFSETLDEHRRAIQRYLKPGSGARRTQR